MFGWGVTTMAIGWTHDLRGLVVCRVFLGMFEAGLLPGSIYIVSMWYKRHEGKRPPYRCAKASSAKENRILLLWIRPCKFSWRVLLYPS
jgi:MFS family permease